MDSKTKRKLMDKIAARFKRKLKGRMVFNLNDQKIGLEYMFGGRWHVMSKIKDDKARTINMLATLEQAATIILEEKHKDQNPLLSKIKIRL